MQNTHHQQGEHDKKMYLRLLLMAVLSFVSMYIFMYSMVNTFQDIYPNFNQFYMAGLMTAPMILIEIALMGGAMYKNKKINVSIVIMSIATGAAFFLGIRQQTAISDEQFLKSMIPHHSGAILMCREANLTDSEIKSLCQTIMEGQQKEIDQMRAILTKAD